jgi:hypothetical protein
MKQTSLNVSQGETINTKPFCPHLPLLDVSRGENL